MKNLLSTRTLNLFPEIDELKKRCIKYDILSSILSLYDMVHSGYDKDIQKREFTQDEVDKYFEFSIDDGYIKILFNKYGCIIVGVNYDSCLIYSSKEYDETLLYGCPNKLKIVLDIIIDWERRSEYGLSFAIWKGYNDKEWQIGKIDFSNLEPKDDNDDYEYDYFDGSKFFLASLNDDIDIISDIIDGNITLHKDISQEIKHIIDFKPINFNFVKNLNPNLVDGSVNLVLSNAKSLGYPVED